MQGHFDRFHAYDGELGMSLATQTSLKAYSGAVERHLSKKFGQLFNLMDAADQPDYCNTDLHRDAVEMLKRLQADPDIGQYIWLTINTDIMNVTTDDVDVLYNTITHVLKRDSEYFDIPAFGRFEVAGKETGTTRLHCHVLCKSAGKRQQSDVRKHLRTKKFWKSLGLKNAEAVQIGDKRGRMLFKKSDKFDYLQGKKKQDKQAQVAADKAIFEKLSRPQFWMYPDEPDEDGVNPGLVDPVPPPTPVAPIYLDDISEIEHLSEGSDAVPSPTFGSTEPYDFT